MTHTSNIITDAVILKCHNYCYFFADPCGPSENEADYQPVLSIGANESKQHCQCNGQA
jgi:hypothetical protein